MGPSPNLIMTASKLLRRHRAEVLRLASAYGATDVRVFGSVARGTDTETRDVDLLGSMAPGRRVFDIGGLLMDLQALLGRRVDIVTERGLRPRLRAPIVRDAVPI
jgi:predicted nucleotidyltransferase